jgi:2'-5' RNA ligase
MQSNIYPNVVGWKKWMEDYQFGTFVFVPKNEIFENTKNLRQKYDPASARTSMPHITLTQPFSKRPTEEHIFLIKNIITSYDKFKIETGPVISSPNNKLIWIDINPKNEIIELRNLLHHTNLFRTDLPFTNNFIPHMTVSEFGENMNIESEIAKINKNHILTSREELTVKWIIPDDNFIFKDVGFVL